jgi:hypothetical protein
MRSRIKWILAAVIVVGVGFFAVTRLSDRAEQAESQANVQTPAGGEAVTAQLPEAVADAPAQDAEAAALARDAERKQRMAAAKLIHEETHASHVKLIEEVKVARAELLSLAQRSSRTQKSLAEARASALLGEEMTALLEDVEKLRAQFMATLNGSPEVAALLEKSDGMKLELADATASYKALRQKMQIEGINDVARQSMLETSSRTTALQRDLSRLNREIKSAQASIREADDDTGRLHASIVEAEHDLEARIKDQPDVSALETEREQMLAQTRETTRLLSELNSRIRNFKCCKPKV